MRLWNFSHPKLFGTCAASFLDARAHKQRARARARRITRGDKKEKKKKNREHEMLFSRVADVVFCNEEEDG